MSRPTLRWRAFWLVLANAALLGALVTWGSLKFSLADDDIFVVPDYSLVVEGRLTQVKVLRQTNNVGFDLQGRIRFGPSNLSSAAELEIEGTGQVTATLMNSLTEVLSGATVAYEIPTLNLRGTLTESSTGRYSTTLTEKIALRSTQPLGQVDAAIGSWRTKALRSFVNNRMGSAFSFLDYRANTVFTTSQPATPYTLPIDVRLRARMLTEQGQPVAGKALEGRAELPARSYAETIRLTSGSDGALEYRRQETIKLTVTGGTLTTLASPVRFDRPATSLSVAGLDGIARQYRLPLGPLTSSSPVVLFWWGDIGSAIRTIWTKLEKMMNGWPFNSGNVAGLDPVDLTIGNAYSTFQDLAIPGRGLGVAFERTYNSRDDTVGPLGFGWSHSYAMRVLPQEDGTVAVVDEDGTWLFYTPASGGQFTAPPGDYSTLTKAPDGTYRLTRKGGLLLAFRADGKLDFLEDPNSNRVTCTYSGSGLLTTITDPAGRAIQCFYDTNNRLIRLLDPAGREVKYEYSGQDLVASVDPAGARTTYTYNAVHQLRTWADSLGHQRLFTYDDESRVHSFSFDQGQHKVVLSYTPVDRKTSVTDARASRTDHRYEEVAGIRVVTERTDPMGGVEKTTWDAARNRTSVTDPLGRITRFSYDARGNLTQVTDPAGQITRFTYEPAFDRLTSVTDPAGQITRYEYDARGNLTAMADPLNQRTTFTYNATGQFLTATDPLGRITTYTYDAPGNLITVRDPMGQESRFTYDAIGNVTGVTDPLARTTAFTYDAKNRLTKITAADGAITEFVYDKAGNRTRVTDPAGLKTDYAYDLADRLVAVTDPLGQATGYQYDAEGNLTKVVDGEGRATAYIYDPLNRLAAVRNALDLASRYTYDVAGNRLTDTRPDGTVLSSTYDTLNRLTELKGLPPQGTTPVSLARFTYDTLGRRTTMADALGTTTYTYDTLSRLTTVDGPGASDTVRYEYDALGNRTRLTDPDGQTATYAYDALSRLTTITNRVGTFTYTYDAAGNVSSLALPNGLKTTYTHDFLNRLTQLETRNAELGTLLSLTYTYDRSGRRTKVTGTVPGLSGTVPVTVDYTYDPASRLTGETRTGASPATVTYAYDKAGNRTEQVREGTKTLWAYDVANRLTALRRAGVPSTVSVPVTGTVDDRFLSDSRMQVTVNGQGASINRTAKTWSRTVALPEGPQTLTIVAKDPASNERRSTVPVTVIDPTKRTFSYDATGQLIEERVVATGAKTLYTYDLLGRLTAVATQAAGAPSPTGVFTAAYDGEGKRVAVSEGGITTTYLYDGLLPLLERQGTTTTASYTWGLSYGGGIGGLLARTTPAGSLFPLSDGSGNILAWTNGAGAVVSTTATTAFGDLLATSGPTQPYGFSTKAVSPATGLVHFGARDYAPALGRWLQPEPLHGLSGPNLYPYAFSDPVGYIDPDGRFAINAGGAVLGAVVGGLTAYASGGDTADIIIGIITGSGAGAINPGGALASAWMAFWANSVAQVASDAVHGRDIAVDPASLVSATIAGGTVGYIKGRIVKYLGGTAIARATAAASVAPTALSTRTILNAVLLNPKLGPIQVPIVKVAVAVAKPEHMDFLQTRKIIGALAQLSSRRVK